ncbi:MAG: hypothetical protein QM529_06745, partial [Hydrotalea sp.]|nr:hypothetical protein [Hydrotalea sp.]
MKSRMPRRRSPYNSQGKNGVRHHFGLVSFVAYLSVSERRRYGLPWFARGLALWGAVGRGYWPYFLQYHQRASRHATHPLDNWSQTALQKITRRRASVFHKPRFHKSKLAFPFSSRLHVVGHVGGQRRHAKPIAFQQLAQHPAIGFTPSPLGMLIHPRFGLWVGFRGATIDRTMPKKIRRGAARKITIGQHHATPCGECDSKPCIAACPAGAVTAMGFDYPACNNYLNNHPACDCLRHGCVARTACPIGNGVGDASYQYNQQQVEFFWRSLR